MGDIDEFAVVAYLPEWRYEGANWEVICSHVSHLIFFSLEVGTPGSKAITALDRLPRRELLEEAKAAAAKFGTRLLVCFGGNGRSAGFSAMVRKPKLRKGFVSSVVKLLDGYGFDGVDYNWEYPGYRMGQGYLPAHEIDDDYAGLERLVRETRDALAPSGKIVTLAYYPDGRQERMLAFAPGVASLLHSMSYDHTGPEGHAPMSLAQKAAATAVSRFGSCCATLGVPFYGRDSGGTWKSYEDIIQAHPDLPPDEDDVDGLSFNGVSTIQAKVDLAIDSGLKGLMIWEVGQDCRVAPVTHGPVTHLQTCPTPSFSLLLAITAALQRRGKRVTTLIEACAEGRVEEARRALRNNANARDACGVSALVHACVGGHVAVARLLINNGAAVDEAAPTTPLVVTCMAGNVTLCRMLILHGANVRHTSSDGASPLYLACASGHVDVVRLLIDCGADLNHAQDQGWTPLLVACWRGHAAVVKVLLKNGADIHHKTADGEAPVDVARLGGRPNVVDILLEYLADADAAAFSPRRGHAPRYNGPDRRYPPVYIK
ncbi:hypothetical protein CTAYLR_000089 [Chrysophaeum taylorii]|uniref:GH18 domain-containing protein n=1 Tax=Chrysophaeum taylorii TaxID=2483200 RepID=A0AAD7XNG2_9STRA|nr:hypothetical protein CTAYLR_000089 [Chrysophaeum taylorii]